MQPEKTNQIPTSPLVTKAEDSTKQNSKQEAATNPSNSEPGTISVFESDATPVATGYIWDVEAKDVGFQILQGKAKIRGAPKLLLIVSDGRKSAPLLIEESKLPTLNNVVTLPGIRSIVLRILKKDGIAAANHIVSVSYDMAIPDNAAGIKFSSRVKSRGGGVFGHFGNCDKEDHAKCDRRLWDGGFWSFVGATGSGELLTDKGGECVIGEIPIDLTLVIDCIAFFARDPNGRRKIKQVKLGIVIPPGVDKYDITLPDE